MKINRVELKNYRIHREYEQDFENGINLLLGNNGSGKSSVLEAIGFALFNSGVRSANEDIVSKGEKSGSAKVFFVGSDGKEYEIERKFGIGAGVKLISSDFTQKFAGNIEVYRQVSKILGTDNINSVFFESVICAKQNQFIDIFTKTDEPRARHFNELFETAIYNDLWKKLGEQNERKYEEDKKLKEERKRTLAERQKNITELENELAAKNKELNSETKKLKDLEQKIVIHKGELDKYNKQKEQINSKETELKNSKANIELFTKMKEQDKHNVEESENARKFLENNKEKFDEYISAKEKSDILENEWQKYKNATKHYEDLQKQQQKFTQEQIKFQGNKEQAENNIKNFEEQISKNQIEQNETQKKLDKINSDKEEKEKELERIKEQINKLTPICAKFEELTKNRENKDREILELKNAEKELGKGICPILKGPCLAGNRRDYFEEHFNKLSEEKVEIEKKLQEKIQITDSEEIFIDKIKEFMEEKKRISIEQLTEIKNIKSRVDDGNGNLKKISNEIQALTKNKEAGLNKLKEVEDALRKNGIEIQELIPKIEAAKKDKEISEKLQTEIREIKTKTLTPLQKIYDECLQKTKTAEEYESRKERLAGSEKNIEMEIGRMDKLNKELNELKLNFSEEQLKLKEEEVKNLNKMQEETIKQKANLERDIEYKNKEIDEYKKTELEISNLDSEIAIIQQKIELTKIFRNQIKDLGRIVAEERVRRIAYIATDYFNKITSRPEAILWVCNESEKYNLYLDNGQNRCSFVNLSGGEQISVAIAIRLALSQEFGNIGLIILDEPTNNLDQYKRQLLAENLPKMVENLTQLFVVTHDDTFRNSATKVIEFGEER